MYGQRAYDMARTVFGYVRHNVAAVSGGDTGPDFGQHKGNSRYGFTGILSGGRDSLYGTLRAYVANSGVLAASGGDGAAPCPGADGSFRRMVPVEATLEQRL